VRAEYGAVKDLPTEQGRGGQGKAAAAPSSSTALALPGYLRSLSSFSLSLKIPPQLRNVLGVLNGYTAGVQFMTWFPEFSGLLYCEHLSVKSVFFTMQPL
jgi:hypothetical protein